LYLEHHLITDALTPPRPALLQVLASQLAMSLEHAQVQAALQQEIEDRKQAEAALQHALAEVAQ
jgi:GAF domain-containing protein